MRNIDIILCVVLLLLMLSAIIALYLCMKQQTSSSYKIALPHESFTTQQCFAKDQCYQCQSPTPTYYECVDNACKPCTGCTTFADDPTCLDSCGGDDHHSPGQPFYVQITTDGKTEKVMFMNTCSNYDTTIDTFGSTILFHSLQCRLQSVDKSCTGDACSWKYYDLLNKVITFTVFIGNVPCGYNVALYTSTIPSQQKYCDAQDGCTEIDFMECNAFGWHTTLHKATGDRDGAPIGVGGTIDQYQQTKQRFVDYHGTATTDVYGYGDPYLINTQKPFDVSFSMYAPSGVITRVEVILEQGSNKIGQIYTEPYDGYYQDLSKELATKQNVLIASAWTGGMDWLDSPPCPQTTSLTTPASIQNIKITTLS